MDDDRSRGGLWTVQARLRPRRRVPVGELLAPWVHRLSRIMHAGDVHKPDFRPPLGPEFTGLANHLTRWEDPVRTADIIELTKSRSYYLAASEATRAKVLANLGWYLHEHLGHTADELLTLPYLTQAWRAVRA